MTEPQIPNRTALADYFAASGFTQGAEIGVGDGLYARTLLDRMPALHLVAVDPWDGGGGNRRDDGSYRVTCLLLAPFMRSGRVLVLRTTSVDALRVVRDGSLDFVFIDAAHEREFVTDDLEGWTPKVRSGGIVSGHDYYTVKNGPVKSGVVQAVDAFVAARGFALQTTPWDRTNPDRDSRQPCWWFRQEAA